ncbi:hypothetical protein [Rhizobium sp. F40D2]|uniref:hypothetical protein n=1 Tax=Rhizobium sp. F40D2 TaxID=3453141 RepID=UPI003F28D26E
MTSAHRPNPYLLLDPRKAVHIVELNAAYADATMTSPGSIAATPLFEAFPDNPEDLNADGVSKLFASLKRVGETGAADAMAIQRYDLVIVKVFSSRSSGGR